MSQTQTQTNKKQGNLNYVHAPNIIKPVRTRINCKKYLPFLRYKISGAPKKFETWPRTNQPYMSSKAKYISWDSHFNLKTQ